MILAVVVVLIVASLFVLALVLLLVSSVLMSCAYASGVAVCLGAALSLFGLWAEDVAVVVGGSV